jgi:hypothetical protein
MTPQVSTINGTRKEPARPGLAERAKFDVAIDGCETRS